jgi:hypothetical protein
VERVFDKYSERVEAVLARSRRARAAIAAAVVATSMLACATPLAPETRALAACAIAWSALRALRAFARPVSLRVDGEGAIVVDGVAGNVVAGSFVAPWLTALRWRPAGAWRDRGLLVLPDMLGADDFRRLRVLLRLAPPRASARHAPPGG